MELSGKLVKIGNDIPVNDTFKKRECVLLTDDQYPQTILIEFTQNNCDKLDVFKVNDEVTIQINIRGREYTRDNETRYFNSIQGWAISHNANDAEGTNTIPAPSNDELLDDLPF